MARPPKRVALTRLRKCQNPIAELKVLSINSPQFAKWRRDTEIAIANTFRDESRHIEDFKKIRYTPMSYITGHPDLPQLVQNQFEKGLDKAAAILESMIDEIREYWEDGDQTHSSPRTRTSEKLDTNEVFIVHGRDESTKQTVARFLEKLRLDPIILHEQPNQGRTLIEKFEEHAQAAFAVILLTPDDVGKIVGEEELKPRARQNVILELGYFLGVLGRERVSPLIVDGVEIPSDYDGVAYVPLEDSGGWRLELIRELKAAGLHVDANLAL